MFLLPKMFPSFLKWFKNIVPKGSIYFSVYFIFILNWYAGLQLTDSEAFRHPLAD